jgi:NADH-quinone oxidoreductase subunit C
MTSEELISFVREFAPEVKSGNNKQYPELIVDKERIHDVAGFLKREPATRLDYLFCQTAADRKDGLHVIYLIKSTLHHHSLMLKVILVDKNDPVVPTVSDVWVAAEFFEREIFDLFGITFSEHPDLRRIFLDDEWVGFPLRKDYKDSFILDH